MASSAQKVLMNLIVCVVTGSVKSPPDGDTAPTRDTEPSRSGLHDALTRPALS